MIWKLYEMVDSMDSGLPPLLPIKMDNGGWF
uniref:Uncharacterized protein n=1 Tax=Utricularia reniformis TaxID=192314 RepID=A0A1Y0B0H9_9LAMI|nr:hypothetical protein AEK19_MT0650 [Utricularia reniformis]ART30903.1 hypothetical protein AEK19_MT0650 [Utricularia reniformis]